jgi:hypothetical protein
MTLPAPPLPADDVRNPSSAAGRARHLIHRHPVQRVAVLHGFVVLPSGKPNLYVRLLRSHV